MDDREGLRSELKQKAERILRRLSPSARETLLVKSLHGREAAMDEHELRAWVGRVGAGATSRRRFTRMMLGLGVTAPVAAQMLASAGVARAPARPAFAPTRRAGGGPVRTLWWQAPVLLNPHLSPGAKDVDASRIFYEPLANFDAEGNLAPVLAAEVPTVQNGGVARDGMSVAWRLKKGVAWHDGKPFTADDVVFTWEYAADPATAAVTSGSYKDLARVEKLDSHTVRVAFRKPTPFWAEPPSAGPRGRSSPGTSSSRSGGRGRARRRSTCGRPGPARAGSWSSGRGTWCGRTSTRATTSRTGRSSTPSR